MEGAMSGRPALLLLLLLLLAGTPRTARCCPGTPGPPPAATADPPRPPPSALGALLRSLQRPGRSPGTPVHPPRSGWGSQGRAPARLSPRSWDPPVAPFWTMATPQRFGRRR